MDRTTGRAEIAIALIDGPVAMSHPDLTIQNIRELPARENARCATRSVACSHGTLIAGILAAKRSSAARGICPDCTLIVRPIFSERPEDGTTVPSTTPLELANAIVDCTDVGARIINLSSTLIRGTGRGLPELDAALTHAVHRGVIVVAAAGNQGLLGDSAITRHPGVIAAVAYDLRGRPLAHSNLGRCIARWGLGAPGDAISGLAPTGLAMAAAGTSVAAPFVSGAIALLWTLFPSASAGTIRASVLEGHRRLRPSLVPPLLDAWSAYESLSRRQA